MPKLRIRCPSLEGLFGACAIKASSSTQTITAISPTQLLLAALGGAERLARLKMLYDKARPRRSRWGPGVLTTEEVFRDNARKDGYSDEGMAMFIDQLDLWSNA